MDANDSPLQQSPSCPCLPPNLDVNSRHLSGCSSKSTGTRCCRPIPQMRPISEACVACPFTESQIQRYVLLGDVGVKPSKRNRAAVRFLEGRSASRQQALPRNHERDAVVRRSARESTALPRKGPTSRHASMNYFRPDIKASVGRAGRDAADSVLQVFDNLQVAGSVAIQGFQQHVLQQPPRNLRGGFRLDKRAVVSHNAKFKVSSSSDRGQSGRAAVSYENPTRMSALGGPANYSSQQPWC